MGTGIRDTVTNIREREREWKKPFPVQVGKKRVEECWEKVGNTNSRSWLEICMKDFMVDIHYQNKTLRVFSNQLNLGFGLSWALKIKPRWGFPHQSRYSTCEVLVFFAKLVFCWISEHPKNLGRKKNYILHIQNNNAILFWICLCINIVTKFIVQK